MKRKIITNIVLILFVTLQIFAEDHPLVKLAEYEQDEKNGLFLIDEKEYYPKDPSGFEKGFDIPFSAECLSIDDEGKIYIYQTNYSRMMYLGPDYRIDHSISLNLVNDPFRINSYKGFFDLDNYFGYYNRFDINGNLLVSLIIRDYAPISGEKQIYYDEQCDVLFFRDSKSNLYSIEHPSMNEAENKANFKGPAETIEMLKSGIYAPHLSTNQYKELCVDGNFYFWEGKLINGKRYQLFSENQVKFYPTLKRDGMIDFIFKVPYGDVESIAIHPCGDLYMLGINWNTNTHILYRVENTWDPEWRSSWYAEHPDAPGKALFGE